MQGGGAHQGWHLACSLGPHAAVFAMLAKGDGLKGVVTMMGTLMGTMMLIVEAKGPPNIPGKMNGKPASFSQLLGQTFSAV
jgi:hypothetical protein